MPLGVTVWAGPTVVFPAGEVIAKWSTSPALKPATANANVVPAAPDAGVIRRLAPVVGDVSTVDEEKGLVVDVGGMIASSAVDDVALGAVLEEDFEPPPPPPHEVMRTPHTTAPAKRLNHMACDGSQTLVRGGVEVRRGVPRRRRSAGPDLSAWR